MASFNRANLGNVGSGRRAVVICFLDAGSGELQEHFLNSAAERIAPQTEHGTRAKIHCEILFPDEHFNNLSSDREPSGESCSIGFNGEVFLKQKQFSRKNWTFRILKRVSDETFNAMKAFCRNSVGGRFNHIGYFLYGITSGLIRLSGGWTRHFYPMQRRWFCSEIVIEALKIGNYLPQDISCVQHPQTVYQLLLPQSSAGMPKYNINSSLLV